MDETRRPNVPVKSIAKTLRIIQVVQELDGAKVTEIAEKLDISKSTAHNHLATLEQFEYVVKEGEEYNLGLRFLDHGEHALMRDSRLELVESKVEQVATETGELCQFMIEEHGKGVVVFRREGANAVETKLRAGARLHLHHTTAGKAILSAQSAARVEEFAQRHGLPAKTENTITNVDELLEELARINERGYAFDKEEHIEGLHAIAVPIYTDEGQVLGALSVAAPSYRLRSDQQETELTDLLLGVANEIELNLSLQ
ncbi:IclR family transcriptional regulator [Haloarcula amylovorans]|uniref:IclR family transcriptional regulator n=1 Tax=Haloarcula amylovorans TaxID=2562280 RepID=UPI0010769E7B|nr:IclR family transcriptional regulator [Halomicroarcula amylolytica]